MPRKSTPAGRLKALIASLTADLSPNGEPLTDAEAAFVELAAACAMRAKTIAEAVSAGQKVDDAELVRLTNTASRIVRDLRDTKDRRASVASAATSPAQSLADNKARNYVSRYEAASPDDDADLDAGPVEPIEPVDATEPAKAPLVKRMIKAVVDAVTPAPIPEAVQTPSPVEPQPAAEPSPAPVTPAKPLKVVFRSKSGGRAGQTLHALVADLRAEGHAPTAPCAVIIPGESITVTLGEAVMCRLAGVRSHRESWFREDVALAIAREQDDRDYVAAIIGRRVS